MSFSAKIKEIRISLLYDCAFTVNCVGRSGGLCILWKFADLCSILNYSRNHIDIIVHESSAMDSRNHAEEGALGTYYADYPLHHHYLGWL